jgi:hypothetical protein
VADDREKKILADLALHPGWAILRQDMIEAKNAYFTKLGKDLYDNPTVTPDDLHYKRGYFHAIFFLLNKPTLLAKDLERELERELVRQREESIV